jgi:aspartate-semialdehyde dehydrogenase
MLKVMEERNFPVETLKLLADATDAGKEITWRGKKYLVEEATNDSFEGTDITLGAASNEVSLRFTPEAVKRGSVVIDNSSAYRMFPEVPLVVPEVNPEDVKAHRGIIANPNCSTVIALVPLKPLHDYAGIRRMIVSTYQAVSGLGIPGIRELTDQSQQVIRGELVTPSVFRHQIAFNVIPHIERFEENGFTYEEMKMLHEGRKILHCPELLVSCTCVRVPVIRSHSESITIETERKLTAEKARELLASAPGVKLVDDPATFSYPMPVDASDQDLVLAGRIRVDYTAPNALSLWVSGDQVRKGAATNAVQIAQLVAKELGVQ